MKKYFLALLILLPFAAQAQLTAVGPDVTKPTKWLSGNLESVYVFFDKATATLSARDTAGVSSTFTWYFLNTADTTLTVQKTETGVTSSSLVVNAAGGYQVKVSNAFRDTLFTCWVFFDNFTITDITHTNECDALLLNMTSDPSIYAGYTIYNFENFLSPMHNGDSTYTGFQSIQWNSTENIQDGVDNPDVSWKTRRATSTTIRNPAPLKNSQYSCAVTDVFGKISSYTTPYTVSAIAAYAKISAREFIDNNWQSISNPTTMEGSALYKVEFSAENSLNAQEFSWKGFGNENVSAQKNLVIWQDQTTNPSSWVKPRVPYKGETLDGYVPGKYTVRLTVTNTTTAARCSDSTSVKITVKQSTFDPKAIPNAFTPNGDGENDYFKFVKGQEPTSIRSIKVYIYSRSGMLVYKYEGTPDEWTGWNGQLLNDRGDVADGVYFFVISGQGWDDVNYDTSEYKGAVHIFR